MQADAPFIPGFADPVLGSQAAFRAIMTAMSEPGRVVPHDTTVDAPAGLNHGLAAVILTLVDSDTPIAVLAGADDKPGIDGWIRFHTGAPVVADPAAAIFVVHARPNQPVDFGSLSGGEPEAPHLSATVLYAVDTFGMPGVRVSGPGNPTPRAFGIAPVPEGFWTAIAENAARRPLGVDVIFASADSVAAIPRSASVVEV